jgi:hypothetical protein
VKVIPTKSGDIAFSLDRYTCIGSGSTMRSRIDTSWPAAATEPASEARVMNGAVDMPTLTLLCS